MYFLNIQSTQVHALPTQLTARSVNDTPLFDATVYRKHPQRLFVVAKWQFSFYANAICDGSKVYWRDESKGVFPLIVVRNNRIVGAFNMDLQLRGLLFA